MFLRSCSHSQHVKYFGLLSDPSPETTTLQVCSDHCSRLFIKVQVTGGWTGQVGQTERSLFSVVNIKVWTDCWWYFPKPNWIGGGYNVKHTSYSNLHTEHPFSTLCADEDMTESLCCKHNSDNELCDFRHRRVCSWSSCSAGCRLSPARIQLLVNPIDAQLDLHD